MVPVHFITKNLKKHLYITTDLTYMLYSCKLLFVFLKNAGHSRTQLENLNWVARAQGNWVPVTKEPQKLTLLVGLPKPQHDYQDA